MREWATDAIRYWEPRRIVYNPVLAAIVITYFSLGWPGTRQLVTLNFVLVLFLLAVLANVAYCAAYAVDIFVQTSGFRELWQKFRWVLLFMGTLFACHHHSVLVHGALRSRPLDCSSVTSSCDALPSTPAIRPR
jgi:hypothetical protein